MFFLILLSSINLYGQTHRRPATISNPKSNNIKSDSAYSFRVSKAIEVQDSSKHAIKLWRSNTTKSSRSTKLNKRPSVKIIKSVKQ
jgi:hypothetical protein